VKADEITVGQHQAGDFVLIVSRCVFDARPIEAATYFEVLLVEVKDGRHFYVNLQEDPRFGYFGWLGKFERKIVDSDMVEHNAYVDVLFVKLAQPTWKLHRHSIARVHRLCEELTKAARKKEKKKP
jgi:hypothetical protein